MRATTKEAPVTGDMLLDETLLRLTETELYEPLIDAGYVADEERLRAALIALLREPALRDWGDDQY